MKAPGPALWDPPIEIGGAKGFPIQHSIPNSSISTGYSPELASMTQVLDLGMQ